MSLSLNTKYRPVTFDTICGQNITTAILKKVVETKSFKNCYLFAGASGCGKTTMARCFANAINNGIGNPIEIDAASNNSVDNVRDIISSAAQRSFDGSEYKIYIIDEAHMLTTAAWNAFLKTIEEPPKYTIFIFCTTEPNKIPQTILNRLQRYNFTAISMSEIKNRLEYICQNENFTNYIDACDLISKICGGSMRNAITILEQCADFSTELSTDVVKSVCGGNATFERKLFLTYYLYTKDEKALLYAINTLYNDGTDLKIFIDSYLEFLLDLNKYYIFRDISITAIPSYLENIENVPSVAYLANTIDNNKLTDFINTVFEIKSAIKYDDNYKSTIEVYLLKLIRG